MLYFLYYLNNFVFFLVAVFLVLSFNQPEAIRNIIVLELFLGILQVLISLFFFFRKSKSNFELDLHLILSTLYLLMLAGIGAEGVEENFDVLIQVLPWFLALLFTYGYRKYLKDKKLSEEKELDEILKNKNESNFEGAAE